MKINISKYTKLIISSTLIAIVILFICYFNYESRLILITGPKVLKNNVRIKHNTRTESHLKIDTIIDSEMNWRESIINTKANEEILNSIALIDILYLSFDGKIHKGQIQVQKNLQDEIANIFKKLLEIKFPIQSVIPLVKYGWDDSCSMAKNNTSCFNYRNINKTRKLSDHAFGRAIDINPMQNPYIHGFVIEPIRATYNDSIPGTILYYSEVVSIFKENGWEWGGDWKYSKDYQHFYKK